MAVLLGTLLLTAACTDNKTDNNPNVNEELEITANPSATPTDQPIPKETNLETELQFVPAFGKTEFQEPVGLLHADDGSGRLFIVEKPGIISILSNISDKATKGVFLDIRDKVNDQGTEQGLLGLAFHPDYEKNGYLYVNYTTTNSTIIERYTTDSKNRDTVISSSGQIVLEFNQPYANHNGGELAFDQSGYLLIATGDGGSGGDPKGNGQNLKTLLGKILRIDINRTSGDKSYAIPSDNPFTGNDKGYREEIYAYGLRNPWRFSIDPETGLLWAADVGQNEVEEINLIEKGRNYGWNRMEGSDCFRSEDCDKSGLTLPVWEYRPLEGNGASVTGGYVYRGQNIPSLRGSYVFTDFIDGRIWALHYDGTNPTKAELLPITMPNITSFGRDEQGELYICLYDGQIMRLEEAKT
ncbi:MAG TPA: PQQ-dependent sugar dehydrogenase [Bacilli bacterium]